MIRIGITANIKQEAKGDSLYQNKSYIKAIAETGAIPYILPAVDDKNMIKEQLKILDGLILPGGEDIDPGFYGEQPTSKLGTTNRDKDIYEHILLDYAVQFKLPVFGICRGYQMLNVYFGGTLYQDISDIDGETKKHCQNEFCENLRHNVKLKETSWLYSIYKKDIVANSYHHQAIKSKAKGFIESGYADDGIIESIEKTDEHFCAGVQWHPEILNSKEIFFKFNEVCKTYKQKKVPQNFNNSRYTYPNTLNDRGNIASWSFIPMPV